MRALLHEDDVFPVMEADLELAIPIDPDAVYYLRSLTVEFVRSVVKRHTRQVPNKRTHQREDVLDGTAVQNDLLDYCVTKWDGVTNNGVMAPCDLTHKLLLPGPVQAALVERAQTGEVTPEAQAASFREPARMVPVLRG